MRVGPALVCRTPSLSGCGGVYSRYRSTRCLSRYRRHAAVGSARRWRLAGWIHWVRPEMVVEVNYAEWMPDGLLCQVVYLGEREDKPANEVRRDPHVEFG